jgi:hypothetical protein
MNQKAKLMNTDTDMNGDRRDRQCGIDPVMGIDATTHDFSSDFEPPIAILEDLMMIAIEEIGSGGGRTLSILLPAIRYVHDLKAINHRLLDVERTR